MPQLKLKRTLRILFILASLSSLYFVPWLLVKAWILPLPNTIQEQVDEVLHYQFDGVIVYIDQTGKEPQWYTAGWHSKESRIPAKPNALFKIASISKLYHAVAITKLVQDGRLSLDTSLASYLPELKDRIEYADLITLRMLVQHRSGIPNYTDAPNFWAAPTTTYAQSLELILDNPANFKPNADYEYCNTNYLLLNKIIDNELGYASFKFIQEEILNPLNLHHTFESIEDVNIDDVMSGYHIGYPSDLKTDDFGMIATAKDVGTFLRALNDGSVFELGEQEIYSSIYEYEHAGWVPGYQSFATYHKDVDAVLVTFYNTTDPDLYNWNLSEIFNTRIVQILRENQNSK